MQQVIDLALDKALLVAGYGKPDPGELVIIQLAHLSDGNVEFILGALDDFIQNAPLGL